MDDLKIFIGGQWRRRQPDAEPFPADGSLNATLNAASLDDLQEAIEAGARGGSRVAGSLPHMRAKILHKVADLIEARRRVGESRAAITANRWRRRGVVMSAADSSAIFAAACELLEGERRRRARRIC
jgi:betaine-aldehyde dehydrogenase